MAKKPFFSIIVPALNEEKYLPKLLGDLCAQSYQDFEVVVVDGGSKDKTINITQAFVSQLPKLTILTSSRAHVCTQRNLGAKAANAEILIFSDADNRLPPYFLQGIKYRWEKEGVDLLSPFIIPDNNAPQSRRITTAINLFIDFQMSIRPKFLLESCFVISKSSFEKINGFDETVNYSEGSTLLSSFTKHGYRARVIKDPNYKFSFRRLKKYGTTKVISDVVTIQLAELLGLDQKQLNLSKLYPMLGGKSYDTKYRVQKNKISKFINRVTKLLKDF